MNRGDGSIVRVLKWDTEEGTNIHSAAIAGKSDVVLALLEANPTLVNATLEWQGLTPLHLAVRHDQLETVQVLLEHGADVNASDKLGRTPLHFAARYCESVMIDGLLAAGADQALMTHEGKTPLDSAREAENAEAIEFLSQ
jgi:ankyrin repeat protein